MSEIRPRHDTGQQLVLAGLRRAILEGVFQPGTRLRQEDLAAAFKTSRIPVRDSLRALEYEGLVSSEPRRGFMVTNLDADEVDEIYDLRILLESHAVRLAVPLMTDDDFADLDELFRQMEEATDADDQLATREAFYLRLYSVSARPRLVGLIMRLRQEVARSSRWRLVRPSTSHHRSFFEAVRAGDADQATHVLSTHYRKVAGLIRRYLREGHGQPAWTSRSFPCAQPRSHEKVPGP